jgi:hypothetical protein
MLLPVYADEQAFHESHICLKCERGETFTPASTTDAIQAYQTLEIGNLRWVGEILQGRCCWRDREMVNENAQR